MMRDVQGMVAELGIYDANGRPERTGDDPGPDDNWPCYLCGETDEWLRTSKILRYWDWGSRDLCATCVGAGPVEAAKRAHARAAAWRGIAKTLPRIDIYYELHEHAKRLDELADRVALIDPAHWSDVKDS